MLWRVNSVQRAMMPHNVAAAFVAVYPFLLAALLALDGPETVFGFHLLIFGFLLNSASCAGKESAAVPYCVLLFRFFISRWLPGGLILPYFPFPSYRRSIRDPSDAK